MPKRKVPKKVSAKTIERIRREKLVDFFGIPSLTARLIPARKIGFVEREVRAINKIKDPAVRVKRWIKLLESFRKKH